MLFTAGYGETGTVKGKALETEIVNTARAGGMRLIGPNGMGLYCPKSGLSLFLQLSREHGTIAVLSHSGSLTNILGFVVGEKGLRFSKMECIGNECDLTMAEFLAYLKDDVDSHLIGIYIEGVKDALILWICYGRRL